MIDHPELIAVLEHSRALGLLGPGAIEGHVCHAEPFLDLLEPDTTVLDLGSGGGVPGLVLACARPDLRFVLLDAGERRAAFLRAAVRTLQLQERVSVECGRAEVLGRRADLRERSDVVVARSFGPPAVTAECAVGFISPSGRLLVSEPSDERDRWPREGLALLGLSESRVIRSATATIREFQRDGSDVDDYPRSVGVPTKRPVFRTH